MPTDPDPYQPCVWPLGSRPCPRRYATVVADLPLCATHAQEAISILLTGKSFSELKREKAHAEHQSP